MTVNLRNQASTIDAPNVQPAKAKYETGGDDIEKDMFLKLMIAQLKNQDPTAPMDQKDMMASMTQFSQVEQMQNMTKAMETLSLAQGVNMVGQHVEYRFLQRNDAGATLVDEVRTGKVVSVEQTNGQVQLTLENGMRVKPSDVSSVSLTARPPQTLVNKYVTYSYTAKNEAGETQTLTLTGRVTGVSPDATKVLINNRLVEPGSVITVSNIPLNSIVEQGGYRENPPAGWT